ncbi:MAG: hypothetical protein GKS04_01805 [Candidatus Mycalebacterium zealandia]|nr:MAG: hypothetical protein GKS04_01805 [Candidatus Mycalebacterium zealandia]
MKKTEENLKSPAELWEDSCKPPKEPFGEKLQRIRTQERNIIFKKSFSFSHFDIYIGLLGLFFLFGFLHFLIPLIPIIFFLFTVNILWLTVFYSAIPNPLLSLIVSILCSALVATFVTELATVFMVVFLSFW